MKPIKSKEVLQSYVLTTSKYDFTVFEKRFLYRLIELGQSSLNGESFKDGCYKVIPVADIEYKQVILPYACLLNGAEDKNHSCIKKAIVSLQQKIITYEDAGAIESFAIVLASRIDKNKATFSCLLHPRIWDCILNFSRGYRKYELEIAMAFESVYSMRFYELISGQKRSLTYTITDLKRMFSIEGKYKNVNDFIRSVIEPAKKELDLKSPFSFEYKANKEGRKYVSFTFSPVHRVDRHGDQHLYNQLSPSMVLEPAVLRILKDTFGFSTKEIKNNMGLLVKAQGVIDDFPMWLTNLVGRARSRQCPEGIKNPQAYLITSLRNYLEQNPLLF